MKNVLEKLREAFPFLNARSGTEEDFFDFCEERGIEVVFTNLCTHGIYVLFEGKHYIFLNKALTGWMMRYVMFHEAAHYLFHMPSQRRFGAAFFTVHEKKKNHSEAEATAALILFPTCELQEALQDAEIAGSAEIQQLIATRLQLAAKYRV